MKKMISAIVVAGALSCSSAWAASGPVGWWQAEGNALDSSGLGNHGTLEGGANAPGFVPGRIGQAFSFNDAGHVNVPDSASLHLPDNVSISFFAQRRDPDSIDVVLEKGGDWTQGQTNYLVGLHQASFSHSFYFCFAGGCRGVAGVADTDMHHYAVIATHGASVPSFFIDGVERTGIVLNVGVGTINLNPSTLPLHLGGQVVPGITHLSSIALDEVRIYDRVLSTAEIEALAAAIPEPTEWILMLAGLGIVAGLARTRTRSRSGSAGR